MIKRAGLILILVMSFSAAFAEDSEKDLFTRARALFEQKKFAESIAIYNKIQPSSDRWLLAVEERAWAQLQLKQFDKAIADARTLTNPALNNMTTTEPYLLRALAELKICDYVAVFKTLKDFKANKRAQVAAIQQLSKTGRNAISQATLTKWMENPDDWKQIGSNLGQMPQLFFRDMGMIRAARAKDMSAMEKRLQILATLDHNENHRILQKLNLIEVESIQRVHIASQFQDKQGEKLEKTDDDLIFKDSPSDEWLDEIGSYQATINRCQRKSGRTM